MSENEKKPDSDKKELDEVKRQIAEMRKMMEEQIKAEKEKAERYREAAKHYRQEAREDRRHMRNRPPHPPHASHATHAPHAPHIPPCPPFMSGVDFNIGKTFENYLSSVMDSVAAGLETAVGSLVTIGDKKYRRVKSGVAKEHWDEFFEKASNILSVLSDANRLKLLKHLEEGGQYQADLAEITNIKGGNFKHHMDILMEKKFVTQEAVRGRYLITIEGREVLKLAEFLYLKQVPEHACCIEEDAKGNKIGIKINIDDDDEDHEDEDEHEDEADENDEDIEDDIGEKDENATTDDLDYAIDDDKDDKGDNVLDNNSRVI